VSADLVSMDVTRAAHVATVTLRGPGKGNALGPDFWRELPIVFGELDADDDVRAVVLTGGGEHFSYGLDLPAMAPRWAPILADRALARPRTGFLAEVRQLQAAIDSVAACRKPVVAAVAGADARFSVREVRVAIVADLGSLQRLAGIIGDGHLRELAFTGADIDAARAERIGLVNDVHPDRDAALAAAHELAGRIAANPPLAVQGTKDVLDVNRGQQVAAGLRYVAAWNAAFLPSEDLMEAVAAFSERRDPKFTGN
jgi:enoyl-CoA hydratase